MYSGTTVRFWSRHMYHSPNILGLARPVGRSTAFEVPEGRHGERLDGERHEMWTVGVFVIRPRCGLGGRRSWKPSGPDWKRRNVGPLTVEFRGGIVRSLPTSWCVDRRRARRTGVSLRFPSASHCLEKVRPEPDVAVVRRRPRQPTLSVLTGFAAVSERFAIRYADEACTWNWRPNSNGRDLGTCDRVSLVRPLHGTRHRRRGGDLRKPLQFPRPRRVSILEMHRRPQSASGCSGPRGRVAAFQVPAVVSHARRPIAS